MIHLREHYARARRGVERLQNAGYRARVGPGLVVEADATENARHLSALAGCPTVCRPARTPNRDDRVSKLAELLADRRMAAIAEEIPDPRVPGIMARLRPQLVARYVAVVEAVIAKQAAGDTPVADITTPVARVKANIEAMQVVAAQTRGEPLKPSDRRKVLRYSGFGGVGDAFFGRDEKGLPVVAERWRDQIPAGFPEYDPRGLINEFYTPSVVTEAVAAALSPYIARVSGADSAVPDDGVLRVLEPSAGVGRFVEPLLTRRGLHADWSLVEYSDVSAAMLRALYPDAQLWQGAFEDAVNAHLDEWWGRFNLILGNPPYGERGDFTLRDPDPAYQKYKNAYEYFVARCVDFLAPNGIMVQLVPGGLLSGGKLKPLREKLLRRAHLMQAFRLPSTIFPGALVPEIDLQFWRARGGETERVLDSDEFILEGNYFERFPDQILGEVVESGKSGRFRSQVVGDFEGLPPLNPRPMEQAAIRELAVEKPKRSARAARRAKKKEEKKPALLGEELVELRGIALGERLIRFRSYLQEPGPDARNRAAEMRAELAADLTDWRTAATAKALKSLGEAAPSVEAAKAVLSAFTDAGVLIGPVHAPITREASDAAGRTAVDLAEELSRGTEGVPFRELRGAVSQRGLPTKDDEMVRALAEGGWCVDLDGDGELLALPARDYYAGEVWDRYDRAKKKAKGKGVLATAMRAQSAELLRRIEPVTVSDIGRIDPRYSYVSVAIVSRWAKETWPEWEREFEDTRYEGAVFGSRFEIVEQEGEYLLKVGGNVKGYGELTRADLRQYVPTQVIELVGFLNNDKRVFKPYVPRDRETKKPVRQIDEVRREIRVDWFDNLKDWLERTPDAAETVESAYNRENKGFLVPDYPKAIPWVERWQLGGITLRPHQAQGANRAVQQNGALLAFDVGVGKTYTGAATIAIERQQKGKRRLALIVPKTLGLKWVRDFQRALPDYSVVLIGAQEYVGRGGARRTRTDTTEERLAKWKAFRAGLYDVALVTEPSFDRLLPSQELFDRYIEFAIAQSLGRKRERKAEKAINRAVSYIQKQDDEVTDEEARERALKAAKASKDKTTLSAREAVKAVEQVRERMEKMLFVNEKRADKGLSWDDLGIDFLSADEAQMFKNLHAPEARSEYAGAKFIGASAGGSARAWQWDLRCFDCRSRGGAVVLLSATPAKNSPLEWFNLLQMINPEFFYRRGVETPGQYCERYIDIAARPQPDARGNIRIQQTVIGFTNVGELRSLVFRYGDFKTAADVNLPVPNDVAKMIEVDLDPEQRVKVAAWKQWMDDVKQLAPDSDMAAASAIVALNRMTDAGVHAALCPEPPPEESIESSVRGPGFKEVKQMLADGEIDPSSPKIDALAELVSKQRGCGHIIFCDVVGAHPLLRQALVNRGIPDDRIVTINGFTASNISDRQDAALYFNGDQELGIEPRYDVVIANKTAEEGIDLQTRTCAIHHADLPWEPSTLRQRNGRGVRQGNRNPEVTVYYYLSRKSADAYRFNMIRGKASWMDEVLTGTATSTANPAAAEDARSDDLGVLLAFASDEEEARKIYEQYQEQITARKLKGQRARALQTMKQAVSVAQRAAASDDPERAGSFLNRLEDLRSKLEDEELDVWPWRYVLDPGVWGRADLYAPRQFGAPLYPGLRVMLDRTPAVVGRVWDGGRVSARRMGQPFFMELTASSKFKAGERINTYVAPEVRFGTLASPATALFRGVWQEGTAEEMMAGRARASGRDIRAGLASAPAEWTSLIWKAKGVQAKVVEDTFSGGPSYQRGVLPVWTKGRLHLVWAGKLFAEPFTYSSSWWDDPKTPFVEIYGYRREDVRAELVPFRPDDIGFLRFLDAAKGSPFKLPNLQRACREWFGRAFPREAMEKGAAAVTLPFVLKGSKPGGGFERVG